MRVNRSVSGETLSLGRGASCKIYLPDARVRLEHAAIRRTGDGHLQLDADGPLLVNDHLQTSARLATGQKIAIGPYDFVVERIDDGPDQADAQITLSFAQRPLAPVVAGRGNVVLGDGVSLGWVTRRRVSWVLCLLVLMFGSALPVWRAFHPDQSWTQAAGLSGTPAQLADRVQARVERLDTFWNPGQVSSAHQNFAQDCLACHDKPFQRVADASCTTCHKNTGAHVADKALDHSAFQGQRCATCHKEHQGATGMRTTDAIGCEQCHGNIRKFAPQTTLANISDFGKEHPAFRLSIRQNGPPALVHRTLFTPGLRNDTGLKFPHDKHLAKVGIKSPTGPPATGGRVVLECASCHTLDAAGVRYAPVRMDLHCQSCHRLSVDPQAPERQVPHAKPADVVTAVREIYASLAVDRIPVNLVTVNSLLQRPAGQAAPAVAHQAGSWVQMQSAGAIAAMFDKPNAVCRTCHDIQKTAATKTVPVAWTIRPVQATDHWLPKSRFSHAQHKNAECAACHTAKDSKSASDILIPDIAACRTCHAGAVATKDQIVSRCDSCHGFHTPTEHPAFRQRLAAGTTKP